MTPKRDHKTLLVFLHLVVTPILFANLIFNINTINIIVVIIIDVQYQKLNLGHRTRNSIKHRTNIFGKKKWQHNTWK